MNSDWSGGTVTLLCECCGKEFTTRTTRTSIRYCSRHCMYTARYGLYVTLKTLASELKLDRSNLRKYALKHGFSFLRVRTAESGNQATLALTPEDADALKNLRKAEGFTSTSRLVRNDGQGVFYAIQLLPELEPSRIKLGFTTGLDARLQSHRTTCPDTKLLKSWPCKKVWEAAALDSISREPCKLVANEVFSCEDIESLLARGDEFFGLMPNL